MAVTFIGGGNQSIRRKPWHVASHWQALSHNAVLSTPRHVNGIGTYNFNSDRYTGSCKSNYYAITTTTAPLIWLSIYMYNLFIQDLLIVFTPLLPKGEGSILFYLCLSVVQDIVRHIFLSHYWWQKSDIWSQSSYRYPISWEAFLDPSVCYFLFADFVDFYTHLTYICICTFFVTFF